MAIQIDILTLFPEMFQGPLQNSIVGRARNAGIARVNIWNIRDFADDKHRVVDDTPYGGGAGMVMKADVLARCIEHVRLSNKGPVVFLTPQGNTFSQNVADRLRQCSQLILLCGHYEGIDERIRESMVDMEISIGDYVLTGGELPAMVVTDAVVRLIPGALGREESAADDSFSHGLLEYPHYTRPRDFRGMEVPEILLSGHHGRIRRWRLKRAVQRTARRRPDLLREGSFCGEIKEIVEELTDDDQEKGG